MGVRRQVATVLIAALVSACSSPTPSSSSATGVAAAVADAANDLTDHYGSPVAGSETVDVLEVGGRATATHFEFWVTVAADIPPVSGSAEHHGYSFEIDLDGEVPGEYFLGTWSDSGAPFRASGAHGNDPISVEATTEGRVALVRVARDAIGNPDRVFVSARTERIFSPDGPGDPLTYEEAFDVAPDTEWLQVIR